MRQKFISVIWGYHRQIFSFDRKQNYHMLPIEAMAEEGYECEIVAIDPRVKIQDDPNFVAGTAVTPYRGLFWFARFLLANRDAVVYSNSLTVPTLLAGLFSRRAVFIAHDQAVPLPEKRLKRLVARCLYRFFRFVRTMNPQETADVRAWGARPYELPLSVSDAFLADPASTRAGLVFVGNIYADKGPEFLLETMRIVASRRPDAVLKLAGEDRYLKDGKNFRETVKAAGLEKHFEFLGFVPHAQLKEVLARSLVFVNTSTSEGMCLAAFEAALAGCLPCLPKITAFPTAFRDGALYHGTPQELADNALRALEDGAWRTAAARANQERILRDYAFERIKKGTAELFLSL